MKIEYRRLTEVASPDLIALMNHPLVRRHMPLASGRFDDSDCARFIATKERLWSEHGFGPWAFVVDGQLAGWGGLQPEQGEADLALVLHPDYWGLGQRLFADIIAQARVGGRHDSVIVLLPATRIRVRGLRRLGFEQDGEVLLEGHRFIHYRLRL